MCSGAGDDHVVGQALRGHAPAVVAHHRDRRASRAAAPPPARRSRRGVPLVDIASSTSPSRPWAMTWREKIASMPMSLAIAVRIAASSVRSRAGARPSRAAGRACRPRRPSRRWPSRRCRGQQPAAAVERVAQRAAAAASASRPSSSVCARSAAISSAFISTDCAHVGEDRVEVVSRTRPGRDRGSSTPRCRARAGVASLEQAAVLEEHVDQLPQQVVGASRPAPGGRTGRRRAGRAPTRPRRLEGEREAAALARQPRRLAAPARRP